MRILSKRAWPLLLGTICGFLMVAWVPLVHAQVEINSQSAFDARIEHMAQALPGVWEGDMKYAIRNAYPKVDTLRLQQLHLIAIDDACNLIPKIGEGGTITITTGFLKYVIMAQQPDLFSVLGESDYADPSKLYRYYQDVGVKSRLSMSAYCKKGRRDGEAIAGMSLDSAGRYFGIPEQRAEATQRKYAGDFEALRLGDYIGGDAIMFAIYHEAEHYLLNRFGGPKDQSVELIADLFAANVMHRTNLSTSLSLWTLKLLAPDDGLSLVEGAKDTSVSCRIVKLLQGEPDTYQMFVKSGLQQYASRAKILHEQLLLVAKKDCS